MALSGVDRDRFERADRQSELVLSDLARLFENPMFVPAYPYPDQMEKTTANVRSSVADVLDPNRAQRSDEFTNAPGQSVAEQIVGQSSVERRGEFFGRSLIRRIFGIQARGTDETVLPPTPADADRGVRAFSQEESLGPYLFSASTNLRNMDNPADPRFHQYQEIKKFLAERLGEESWKELQDHPGIKAALLMIVNLHTNPPGNPLFNAENFVKEAVGTGVDSKKAEKDLKDAEAEFQLMDKRISDASGNVDQLFTLSNKLQELCPNGYKARIDEIEQIIGKKRATRVSPTGLQKELGEEEKKIKDAGKRVGPRDITAIVQAASAKAVRIQEKIDKWQDALGEIKKVKSNIERVRVTLMKSTDYLRNTPEKTVLLTYLNRISSPPSTTPGGTIEKNIDDKDIDNFANDLINYQLKDLFEKYASGARSELNTEIKERKDKAQKALDLIKGLKENKFTPNELVYKLFHKFYTTKQNMGGALPNHIDDHWIDDATKNEAREKALLATRFMISDVKDVTVFESNKYLAEHAYNQRSRFSGFMARARSNWFVNKLAMAIGKPEQISFNKIVQRMRTIEVNGRRPFTQLDLKWVTTRGDLRKAMSEGKIDEKDLPLLASYLETILRGAPVVGEKGMKMKIEIKPAETEMYFRTIRNLKVVRQEILHKQFTIEVGKKPNSFPEKLTELWQKKWAEEEAFDTQMADEARKREFIAFLEKEKFNADKKAFVADVIEKLRSGEYNIDKATQELDGHGYKVGRWTGLGLWGRMTGRGAKEAAKGAAIKGAHKVGEKLAPVAQKLGITKASDVIYKPIGFVGWTLPKTAVWNVPKGILWSSKIRGKEHDGVLKYVWKGVKQVVTDFGSVAKTALTDSGTAGSKPAASHTNH